MSYNGHTATPFLRWAGGKRWFCKKIAEYLPDTFTDYYEPFLGGGSVFFYLQSHNYLQNDIFLSDYNGELILAYKNIQTNSEKIIRDLYDCCFTEEEYYFIRKKYNSKECSDYEKAFYLIYLNIAGFNGIYRVSREGKFNVPYGNRGHMNESYASILMSDSRALEKVNIYQNSFEYMLSSDFHFKKQSLVFIDPPYTVSHNNNGFIAYNKNLFDLEKQYTLRKLLDKIDLEGSFFIMTNAHHNVIRTIFDGYYFSEENRASVVGGINAKRGNISEYIVCNFRRKAVYDRV